MNQTKHPFIILSLLISVFLIPLLLAYWFYAGHHTAGEGYNNRGDLVTPPFQISTLELRDSAGNLFKKTTKKQWILMFFYPEACKQECKQGLYYLRQIRTATGKNRDRVARALLTEIDSEPADLKESLASTFPGTLYLTGKESILEPKLKQHVQVPYALEPGTFYLVDPLGNLMMSYAPNTAPESILKDLKFLLTVSQIG